MLVDLYGELKLTGSLTPIIFDNPIAISEYAEKSKYINNVNERTPNQASIKLGITPFSTPLNILSDQPETYSDKTNFLNKPIPKMIIPTDTFSEIFRGENIYLSYIKELIDKYINTILLYGVYFSFRRR